MNSSSSQIPQASRKPITLLHTSDVHVGSDVYPEAALRAFDDILALTLRASADALLIAGDLFDSRRVPTETIAHVYRSLEELACPVVLLPGNHDTLLTASSPGSHELPANLRIFRDPTGEVISIKSLNLSVWGRPIIDHQPHFRPLENLKPRPSQGWYVAMGHGMVLDENIHQGRSSPITLEELAQADCDYIALGHVHQFRDVTQGGAPAFYSGDPSVFLGPTAALVILDPVKGVDVKLAHL